MVELFYQKNQESTMERNDFDILKLSRTLATKNQLNLPNNKIQCKPYLPGPVHKPGFTMLLSSIPDRHVVADREVLNHIH